MASGVRLEEPQKHIRLQLHDISCKVSYLDLRISSSVCDRVRKRLNFSLSSLALAGEETRSLGRLCWLDSRSLSLQVILREPLVALKAFGGG